MCGIAGVASLNGPLDSKIRAALPAMTGALRHRGPDGDGFFSDSVAALGHRRLAIIDRQGGKQPLSNEDDTIWITFNGEVYNHHELRDHLVSKGHVFRTKSDTEAIVHAYEEFGERCVDRLEGMFAFAIYDLRKREVFIARDRLGKKPLFYAVLGEVLHFASEIKAIAASPAWDPAIDLDELESYLSLGYFLAPKTIYRHVRKLEPGHWLRLRHGRLEIRKYWDIEEFDTFVGTADEAVAHVGTALQARVGERLESEVPLGAFLSGGIDSGLVVSYMAGATREPVITTSVGFDDAAHNELDAAALTAARFETAHYGHVVEPQLEEIFDPIVRAFDEPFADSSSIPTWYVSREARRHVTVALSGDGGDETFGGYDFRYVPHALEQRARRLLPTPLRAMAGALGRRWPRHRLLPRPLRLGTYLENVAREPETAYYADLCFLKPHATRVLMGRPANNDPRESAVYAAVTAPYRRCPSTSVVQRAEYADLKIYLANDVLVKVDRMSMQHGLEVRCPLLDRRIVELAFRLPQRLKQAEWRGKELLKSLARERLPTQLLGLRKHGFTAPVGTWIRGAYANRYESDVLGPGSFVSSILDSAFLRRCFNEHRRGHADHGYLLWAVWVLERWGANQGVSRIPARAAQAG
jgi:asparagine synthase (glutamine-hydrolysing)